LVSELKVDARRYVEDRKFYDKVRGREVLRQRKLQLIAKEGEGVAGAQGLHKTLQGKSAKPADTSNENWEEMDLKTTNMIQLCLADEVMYNVMDEKMATGLWSRLDTLYMTKSLFNKLYLKKQLYGLRVKEGTTVLEHLNLFNKVINELLAVDVKIDEEDKALILLSSLSESYDHIISTMLKVRKLSSWRRSR